MRSENVKVQPVNEVRVLSSLSYGQSRVYGRLKASPATSCLHLLLKAFRPYLRLLCCHVLYVETGTIFHLALSATKHTHKDALHHLIVFLSSENYTGTVYISYAINTFYQQMCACEDLQGKHVFGLKHN